MQCPVAGMKKRFPSTTSSSACVDPAEMLSVRSSDGVETNGPSSRTSRGGTRDGSSLWRRGSSPSTYLSIAIAKSAVPLPSTRRPFTSSAVSAKCARHQQGCLERRRASRAPRWPFPGPHRDLLADRAAPALREDAPAGGTQVAMVVSEPAREAQQCASLGGLREALRERMPGVARDPVATGRRLSAGVLGNRQVGRRIEVGAIRRIEPRRSSTAPGRSSFW